MGRQFRFRVDATANDKLDFLRQSARRKGIAFDGDDNKGTIWGHGLVCNYFKLGNEMILNIESIPMGSSFEQIEKLIENFFTQ